MSMSKIMLAVIVGCCVSSMTFAEPPAKPAQRGKRQMKPAVEKQTDAEQGRFSGRIVQMNEKRIVVRNWQEKMTFRPLRPKVKAPEGLTAGDFVKVEWAVAGKGKRIKKIEKIERPARRARPAAGAEATGQDKGKGEMKRDQAKKGQGEGKDKNKREMKCEKVRNGQGKGKGEMKGDQVRKGQGQGGKQGAGKGERKQKRDQSCEGCPKAAKAEK